MCEPGPVTSSSAMDAAWPASTPATWQQQPRATGSRLSQCHSVLLCSDIVDVLAVACSCLPAVKPVYCCCVALLQTGEFARGKIDGAENWPLSTLRQNVSKLPRDRKLYVYCQVRAGWKVQAAAREEG